MNRLVKQLGGALTFPFLWAGGWAGLGMFIEIFEPDPRFIDMWPQTLAIPGFIGGLIFSIVLRIAERGRRFDELTFLRAAAWGALAGVLLGGFVTMMVAADELHTRVPIVITTAATILSIVSACGLLLLARIAKNRQLLGAQH